MAYILPTQTFRLTYSLDYYYLASFVLHLLSFRTPSSLVFWAHADSSRSLRSLLLTWPTPPTLTSLTFNLIRTIAITYLCNTRYVEIRVPFGDENA